MTLAIPVRTTTGSRGRDHAAGLSRMRVFEIAVSILMAAGFFVLVSATPDIPSATDGYRHATQAWRLVNEPKAMFADPWHLAYLWSRPVDGWFGYHVLLAPFVLIFERITAIKMFTSIVFGSIAYVMFRLLTHLGASYRVLWVLLALTGCSVTLSRATSVRPFLLSLLLTLLAALFTVEDRAWKLGLVSLIHGASYSIFFMVGLGPAMWLLLRRDRRSLVMAVVCASGVGLGLLANPYFPENVKFDFYQASVVSISRAAHVQIASELSPADWWSLAACLPAALPWLAAVALRLFKWRETSQSAPPAENLLLALSAVTFLETLNVVRTLDFFIPFSILFAAATLSPYLKGRRADVAVAGLLLAIPCAANVYLTLGFEYSSPKVDRFRGAAAYLKANATGELVMNTEWAPDYFFLFYLNDRSRYVIGIDPTFTYRTDPRKYWLWRHIYLDEPGTCGQEICSDRVDPVIATRDEIRARYVVIDHVRSPVLEAAFRRHADVSEVYRDSDLSVYRLD